jgi:hypothetical protein
MFCRWAGVNVTLPPVTAAVCGSLSFLDEQPGSDMIAAAAMAATASARLNPIRQSAAGASSNGSFINFIPG